jgi:hypothetical protein
MTKVVLLRSHRPVPRRRLPRWALPATLAAGAGALCAVLLIRSPWPVGTTLRHAFAGFNCASARGAGLAQARQGEPGYWSHLDADRDGIACEPGPTGRAP